jgi:hypothetical protein
VNSFHLRSLLRAPIVLGILQYNYLSLLVSFLFTRESKGHRKCPRALILNQHGDTRGHDSRKSVDRDAGRWWEHSPKDGWKAMSPLELIFVRFAKLLSSANLRRKIQSREHARYNLIRV